MCNAHRHAVHDLARFEAAKTRARDRLQDLLVHVMRYPHIESRTYTSVYGSHNASSDGGVRYCAYMYVLLDIIRELFETAHCSNFPDHPCDRICPECIDRVMDVINLKRYMVTHQAWWLEHNVYFEDRHPVFARFIFQVLHLNPDDPDTHI